MNPGPADLTTLIGEAQRGSVPAFEQLYRDLSPSVASYLRCSECRSG